MPHQKFIRLCTSNACIMLENNYMKSLPNINTEAAIMIEFPTLPIPMLCAKSAAKQPSPPPIIVPSPRLKPFPSVAPDMFMCIRDSYICNELCYVRVEYVGESTCREFKHDNNCHDSPHCIFSKLLKERVQEVQE